MKIERWRDVAELVALVAVVASLFAVVIELRQTQEALQAQTYQERAFDAIDLNLQIATNSELRLLPSDFDPDALTDEEFENAQRLYNAILVDLDNEYYQYQHGFLDSSFYASSTMTEIKVSAPIWRKLGVQERRAEFHAEVERILMDESIPAMQFGRRSSSR